MADSEVEEMSIWAQVNLWKIHRDGTLDDTANIRSFTRPTGLRFDPATGRLFISDDSARKIFIVSGTDGKYGTSDDVRTSFSTTAFGNTDPVDVAFATATGELFTADGLGAEIYRISPGPNRTFEGAGDDVITHFDVMTLRSAGRRRPRVPPRPQHAPRPGWTLDHHDDRGEPRRHPPHDDRYLLGTGKASRRCGGSTGHLRRGDNLFMVARGVDNNSHPNENDGKMYEFSVNRRRGTTLRS